uniref:(California timema) hypothetical protein n=1 Tax=Timema californicum TaxID=61474 RepID=A0A7R9J7G9_TIMCA|nr:unnamed protein product [Timema californicum]
MSSPDRDSNLNLPVLSSLAQHDERVSQLRHRGGHSCTNSVPVRSFLYSQDEERQMVVSFAKIVISEVYQYILKAVKCILTNSSDHTDKGDSLDRPRGVVVSALGYELMDPWFDSRLVPWISFLTSEVLDDILFDNTTPARPDL